jgi:hypothetical protein
LYALTSALSSTGYADLIACWSRQTDYRLSNRQPIVESCQPSAKRERICDSLGGPKVPGAVLRNFFSAKGLRRRGDVLNYCLLAPGRAEYSIADWGLETAGLRPGFVNHPPPSVLCPSFAVEEQRSHISRRNVDCYATDRRRKASIYGSATAGRGGGQRQSATTNRTTPTKGMGIVGFASGRV